jgi:hypothetical protein
MIPYPFSLPKDTIVLVQFPGFDAKSLVKTDTSHDFINDGCVFYGTVLKNNQPCNSRLRELISFEVISLPRQFSLNGNIPVAKTHIPEGWELRSDGYIYGTGRDFPALDIKTRSDCYYLKDNGNWAQLKLEDIPRRDTEYKIKWVDLTVETPCPFKIGDRVQRFGENFVYIVQEIHPHYIFCGWNGFEKVLQVCQKDYGILKLINEKEGVCPFKVGDVIKCKNWPQYVSGAKIKAIIDDFRIIFENDSEFIAMNWNNWELVSRKSESILKEKIPNGWTVVSCGGASQKYLKKETGGVIPEEFWDAGIEYRMPNKSSRFFKLTKEGFLHLGSNVEIRIKYPIEKEITTAPIKDIIEAAGTLDSILKRKDAEIEFLAKKSHEFEQLFVKREKEISDLNKALTVSRNDRIGLGKAFERLEKEAADYKKNYLDAIALLGGEINITKKLKSDIERAECQTGLLLKKYFELQLENKILKQTKGVSIVAQNFDPQI